MQLPVCVFVRQTCVCVCLRARLHLCTCLFTIESLYKSTRVWDKGSLDLNDW